MSVVAHTHLDMSFPANGSVIQQSPDKISLTFSGDVRPLRVKLSNSEGREMGISFERTKVAARVFDWPVTKLDKGNYLVDWAVIGADGHKMTGQISFSIQR